MRQYLQLAMFADQARPANLAKLPLSELKVVINALCKNDVRFPSNVRLALLEHRVNIIVKDLDFDEIIRALFPWGVSEWAPLAPCVSALGWNFAAASDSFKRTVFSRVMIPLIAEGAEKASQIADLCTKLEDKFESEDILELPSAAASLTAEVLSICRILKALIAYPLTGIFGEDFSRMDAMQGKPVSKSLFAVVGHAIWSSDYFGRRWKEFMQVMPLICENGERIEEIIEVCTGEVSIDESSMAILEDSCNILVRLRAAQMPAELLDRFASSLQARMSATIAMYLNNTSDPSNVSIGQIAAMESLMNMAAAAFPTDTDIFQAKARIASMKTDLASASVISRMVETLNACTVDFVHKSDAVDAQVLELQAVSTACAGLALHSDAASIVKGMCVKLAVVLQALLLGSEASDEHKDSIVDLFDKFCELLGDRGFDAACRMVHAMRRAQASKSALEVEDGASRVSDEAWCALQVLSVEVKQLRDDECHCREDWLEECASGLLNVVADFIVSGTKMIAKLTDMFKASKVAALNQATQRCRSVAKGFIDEGMSWRKGAKPNDKLEVLEKMAKATLETLDLKDVVSAIAGLRQAMDEYERMAKTTDDKDCDATMAPATSTMKAIIVLKAEAGLLWHFASERDHDNLRAKVQAEVRDLRSCGIGEKTALHSSIFKRSHDALLLTRKK